MLLLCLVIRFSLSAQPPRLWNNEDREYLKENLIRSRDAIAAETKNLSPAQWNFKESPGRWSINQIVEHLALWELLLEREINQALYGGYNPELAIEANPDSVIINYLQQEKPHITTDYTKPFTFTVPSGANEGQNNLSWFLNMRNEGIQYVDTTTADLRYYFLRPGRGNVHQVFITIFAHTDRHLRQIKKVKRDPNYPK